MFNKIIEVFLPQKLKDSLADLRSERIFVAVLLISALSDLAGINLASEIGLTVVAYLLLVNAGIIFLLLLLYKQGLSKKVVVHIYILQHVVSFALQAWYQGGLISPAVASFFLLPAVTILILGKNSAIFWFFVIILIITGFFIYESSNGAPQINYDESKKLTLFFGGVLGTSIYILIILLVYESSKNRAIGLANKKNDDLVATQTQLIHSEKMASLGELTAGIAHEIQNPLNFVNNFSEVNTELIDELNDELGKGNIAEAIALARDIKENEAKINHHGKRADGIVKGMLQHSRSSSNEKEPTDINALCDEYLRLAYHGLRARDKSFNAKFETKFDAAIGKVKVVPQDIGRVVLNLITNAFYAVTERKKLGEKGYDPMVKIVTARVGNKVEIKVLDNGNGIPQKLIDKIFQPFFTTKPTGQGTGLGLSMSYDIVTKVHGGELKVTTQDSEFSPDGQSGSEFIITLPV